jgi:hypothetical protein
MEAENKENIHLMKMALSLINKIFMSDVNRVD